MDFMHGFTPVQERMVSYTMTPYKGAHESVTLCLVKFRNNQKNWRYRVFVWDQNRVRVSYTLPMVGLKRGRATLDQMAKNYKEFSDYRIRREQETRKHWDQIKTQPAPRA